LCLQTFLNSSFLALARELDIVEAKSPDDVYKANSDNRTSSGGSHPLGGRPLTCAPVPTTGTATTSSADSARGNLAATFVSAFVNGGKPTPVARPWHAPRLTGARQALAWTS
jgi:26S proteasome regulatory subunit N1